MMADRFKQKESQKAYTVAHTDISLPVTNKIKGEGGA